jgi:quercetin dioxygenase-like cupin family protein
VNLVEFEPTLRQDGFDEIVIKELPAAAQNNSHGHSFDAKALILEGEITLTVDGVATVYPEGTVFYVPAGCLHQETVPAGGVRYLLGKRHAASSNAG